MPRTEPSRHAPVGYRHGTLAVQPYRLTDFLQRLERYRAGLVQQLVAPGIVVRPGGRHAYDGTTVRRERAVTPCFIRLLRRRQQRH